VLRAYLDRNHANQQYMKCMREQMRALLCAQGPRLHHSTADAQLAQMAATATDDTLTRAVSHALHDALMWHRVGIGLAAIEMD
jgi:hypothetical protein